MWDPSQRISATEALSHPYTSLYHDPEDEPVAGAPFDWTLVTAEYSVDMWKYMMLVSSDRDSAYGKMADHSRYSEIMTHLSPS